MPAHASSLLPHKLLAKSHEHDRVGMRVAPAVLDTVALGVPVGVALRIPSAMVWRELAPAGTTSRRLPAVPAAATRDGALAGVVVAVPALCESTGADPLCRRGPRAKPSPSRARARRRSPRRARITRPGSARARRRRRRRS